MSASERLSMSFKSIYFFVLNERKRLENDLECSNEFHDKIVELDTYKRIESLFNAQISEMTSILDDESEKDQD
jgi:hypothetical protein